MPKKEPRPVGRPIEYDPEYPQMLLDYFSVAPYTVDATQPDAKPKATDLPTLAGFCVKIGIHRGTLWEWAKIYPELSDALVKAKEYQENHLVATGMKGIVNTPFAIFVAKNVMGWRDQQAVEVKAEVKTEDSAQLQKELDELKAMLQEKK